MIVRRRVSKVSAPEGLKGYCTGGFERLVALAGSFRPFAGPSPGDLHRVTLTGSPSTWSASSGTLTGWPTPSDPHRVIFAD